MRTSAAGCGIAPAAVRQLVRWAFTETDLHRLEIVVAVGNVRSQRVAAKSGSRREAVLRDRLRVRETFHDAIMNSILRSEWEGTVATSPDSP